MPSAASRNAASFMTIRAANLARLVLDVILDDDLQPERAVIEGGGDQQQTSRTAGTGLSSPVDDGVEIGAGQPDDRDHEPQGQRHQRDRRDPLRPPVLDAFLRRAEPDRPAQRRVCIARRSCMAQAIYGSSATMPAIQATRSDAVPPSTTQPPR